MRYYFDLTMLAFWIGIFIHSLIYPGSSVVISLAPWAFLSCVASGVGKMIDHALDKYMQKLSKELQEDNKEDE